MMNEKKDVTTEEAERAALMAEIRANLERLTDEQCQKLLEELIRDGILKG